MSAGASLTTEAEERAEKIQHLPPFQDLNLSGIKSKVAESLQLIGRSGIFGEYTLHDISHVEKMLGSLVWLIPEQTKGIMTPADWLLAVLSIYFHDLGMLVTDEEYEARSDSDFPEFCDQVLFAGKVGTDYENKVAELGGDQERFLYQEYVRYHHAERISEWIQGKVSSKRGIAHSAAAAVGEMLTPLPATFRADLALVCASHHLNDLQDVEKYRVSRPYGDSPNVTANVQYAAFLLRSADLLHITNDRTPSVMFRLISPQDPVSQREWAKQSAVDSVRAQKGRDESGDFSSSAPQDTVEVFATFEDAEAFFGLTSYLLYAEEQLKQVADWAKASVAHFDTDYRFPWSRVDTSEVRALGFAPKQLSFTLDQGKILELLTGHTLYNDTSVVLRELVQNALDASRLQALFDGGDGSSGSVTVEWQSESRELIVRDNGTGMTAAVIERNLLKAGSSRYQEEEFKDQHPEFSPISRFGIGVLSAFMIADSVEITTCHPDEDQIHQLTLRSVLGKYLVRLIDKSSASAPSELLPHGTEVRLRVRKSAEFKDVGETLRRWVVIPRCSVRSIIDGTEVADLGFESPKAALEAALQERGLRLHAGESLDPSDRAVKVTESSFGDAHTALALRWNRVFRQWEFMRVNELRGQEGVSNPVGTCVEGIRVEESSPGFLQNGVVALVDARGLGAPKTNVARAGLENTPERRILLQQVYRSYIEHVESECLALMERGQSLTWASQESEILLDRFLEGDQTVGRYSNILMPADINPLAEAIEHAEVLLIETQDGRRLSSAASLSDEEIIWTIDSGLVRSAEGILREIPAEGSLRGIASSFSDVALSLPDGVALPGYQPDSMLYEVALSDREVGRLAIRPFERRVDVGWVRAPENPNWLEIRQAGPDEFRGFVSSPSGSIYVGRNEVPVEGRGGEVAIRAHRAFFLFPDSQLAQWIIQTFDSVSERNARAFLGETMMALLPAYLSRSQQPEDVQAFLEALSEGRVFRRLQSIDGEILDLQAFIAALEETPPVVFDTWAWNRASVPF